MTIAGDQVSVMVRLAVPPAVAFDVFTQEIDLWWRKGVAYRASGRTPGVFTLEPRVGGRLFEEYEGPAGLRVHEAGRVTIWNPPSHLEFEWRGSNFAPGESTIVEVKFVATDSGGTQVRLVHRGFAALRPDHPVRHGEPVVVFIRTFGTWWSGLLMAFRDIASDRVQER
jgi:uncharacterized protein YndB with AHSA1/START domain